jgi:excisionase family DNA binding protein
MFTNKFCEAIIKWLAMSSPFSVLGPIADGRAAELETPVDVKTAARFLGISASLVYAYVERKQIPHFRMMGRAIRFRLSELDAWRQQFHVNGGING